MCWENPSKNQLLDTLDLFKEIVNLPNFRETPFYIWFNKKDLFESTLKAYPLKKLFPHYKGGSDVNEATKYLMMLFTDLIEGGID